MRFASHFGEFRAVCAEYWTDSQAGHFGPRREGRGALRAEARGPRRERLGPPSFVVLLAAARLGRHSTSWATGIVTVTHMY
jgi:hypothetical protein